MRSEILQSELTKNFYIRKGGLFFAGFDSQGNSGWTDENGAKPFSTELEAQIQCGLLDSFANGSSLKDYEHQLRLMIASAEIRGWWDFQASLTHALSSLIELRKTTRTFKPTP